MAKTSGLGMTVAVDDSAGVARTISNNITAVTISTPRAEQDITGVDKSGRERLLLLVDFVVGLSGVLDTAANMSHAVFKTVPSTSVARTTTLTIASQVLAGELLYTDYNLSRGAGGEATFTAPGALADGTVPTWA